MDNIKSPSFILHLTFFYAYYLPIILYVLWTPLAIYELNSKSDLTTSKSIIWTSIILFLPWIGSLVYFYSGLSNYPKKMRITLTIPGIFLIILFILLSSLFSS
jgi:hypothetical protein